MVKILCGVKKGHFMSINAYIALITQLHTQYFPVIVTLKVWDLINCFYLFVMSVRKCFVKISTPVCCACLLSNSSSTQKTSTFWATSFPGSSLYLKVERGPWERGWDLSSYIFMVRPAFHTDTSRKRNCLKTPFKPEEFENTSFSMLCGLHENILKMELLENDCPTMMRFPSVTKVSVNHKSNLIGDCCVVKFLQRNLSKTFVPLKL